MPQSGHHSWDFDRPSGQTIDFFSTFSVGIFQWLPKAGGKGIKKSKAIARVLGYTAEPERVLEKANDLCSRLNREAAAADVPPAWLQKQYSIPRPAGTVVKRTSSDFTAAQVRAMRLRTMKNRLLPSDFVVGKDATYVRRFGEQLHLINFQGSRYGRQLTVNLGFHYSFVPPLLHERALSLTDFHLLDCITRGRIGYFLPDQRDVWFEYGQDGDRLMSKLELCATTCLETFDRFAARWKEPSVFLNDLADGRNSGWDQPDDLGAACVALRTGRLKEVRARLEQWNDDRYPKPPPFHVWLSKRLNQAGARSGDSVKWVELPDWVETPGQSEEDTPHLDRV